MKLNFKQFRWRTITYLQILCLAEQIRFTECCEHAISKGSLPQYNKELASQLESYTDVDLEDASSDTQTHVLDLKLKALILDTIHAIDVVQQLMQAGTRSPAEWMWNKQLRYLYSIYKCFFNRYFQCSDVHSINV